MHDRSRVRKPLTVAVAQPRTVAGDLEATVAAHAALIRRARARLVIFPELSVTGYHLDVPVVDPADAVLDPLRGVCADLGCTALVGAPIRGDGVDHIAMLLVDADGVRVVYRKAHPGGDETDRFAAGPGAVAITVAGRRVGLAICRDTGIAAHIERTAALDIDLFACGVVYHGYERAEQDRRSLAIAATCGAPVAMASCAGPTGEGYNRTAGHSSIRSAAGVVLAEAGAEPDDVVRATLD